MPSLNQTSATLHTARILTIAAAGMAILLALAPQAGHDQLWLLIAASRIGPHLNPYGPTVLESNPPLAIWLSALVLALARALHLPLTLAFKLAVSALSLASALVSYRLLQRLTTTPAPARRWFLAALWILLTFALPARDFGQRDHLLLLLVLPYLLAAACHLAARPLPVPARLLLTTLAAIGIALKPHQTLIPIAIELLLWLPRTPPSKAPGAPSSTGSPVAGQGGVSFAEANDRTPSPSRTRILEPPIFLLAALTYVTAIHHLAPTYLTEVLPLLRDTYWAFGNRTPLQLLSDSPQLHLLALAALILFFLNKPEKPVILSAASCPHDAESKDSEAVRPVQTSPPLQPVPFQATPHSPTQASRYPKASASRLFSRPPKTHFSPWNTPSSPLQKVLLTAALAATIAFYLQSTGWYYQQLPALTLFALALAFTPISLPTPPWQATAALTALALALTWHFSDFGEQPTPDPAFYANATSVATLTTTVDDTVPPAFTHHLLLAQRYPHLWLLPAILRNQSGPPPAHAIPPERLAELAAYQHRIMVADLTRWHPDLILVARCQDPQVHCQVLEDRHDDLLAWFLQDPAFRTLFARYHFDRASGPYDAYRRNPPRGSHPE